MSLWNPARLRLLGSVLLAIAGAAASVGAQESPMRPLVGAIRWDAWHGDKGTPGQAVQRALGPAKWHHRLPFFAQVRDDGSVAIDGARQDVMDQEIRYAVQAGLDYWAFVTYPPDTAMSLGLKLYLTSRLRTQIRFCLVTECSRWRDPAFVSRLAKLMREPGYQTVCDGRPLLYLGFITADKLQHAWQGADGFRKVVDGLRATALRAGLKDPYVVVMDSNPAQGKRWAEALGCQAISSYAAQAGGRGASYAALARHAEASWARGKAIGAHVVPLCMAGWDRRPRVEHPVPWETWQKPGQGLDRFYHAPTPAELATHVQDALDWLRDNPAAPARCALIYAWNENDEGGWLVPTLAADGTPDTRRIEALGHVLRRPPAEEPRR